MQLDHVKLANPARIACTMRTLKPYSLNEGNLEPWVHSGEASQALLYLAARIEFAEIHALKELLEELSSSLKNSSDTVAVHQDEEEPTEEQ
ncbi:hypothetical protein [Eel River basin pequenovirus]|nr:hypothetical protein [Eel River basin pequenovirus]